MHTTAPATSEKDTITDYGHDLLFGCFLTPDAGDADGVVDLARLADGLGLDLIGVQDHPYQPRFLDMWTLLSVLASQTERIRLVPDVVNLPLRPPAVLAGAAASLDILSGGRVELGLGSGAFAAGSEALGGPRRAAGPAVAALEEAITVIRSLWTSGPPVTFDGTYYTLKGAQPGPFPVHPIGIWLGAYKPRMLQLTGRTADGWIPSSGYAAPEELAAMTRTIDDAAMEARRDPAAIRRVYNISGRFSTVEGGFLQGPPQLWISQLTELTLEHGFSTYVLAPGEDAVGDLERFAREVAPGVRKAVNAARSNVPVRPVLSVPAPTEVVERPSGTASTPQSPLLDDSTRPHGGHHSDRPYTAAGRASQQTLVQVHDHLRSELVEIQRVVTQVVDGRMDPATARSHISQMTIRQNYWTLGAFCAQYCRLVTMHHTIEDRHLFPALEREEEGLAAVLRRLGEEHEVIAQVIDRFDRGLVAMMTTPADVAGVQTLAQELSDSLLSHLAYEEDELLGPLGRSSIAV